MQQPIKGRPYKCPYCGCNRSTKKGFRYTKTGKVPMRRCKLCGRRYRTKKVLPL